MSTEKNKEIAKDFLNAIVEHDGDRLNALMSDDATYWAAGKPHLFPPAGVKTKAEFVKLMSGPTSFKEPLVMTVGAITAEEDRVALEAESRGVVPSGKLYNNHYHFLFTIRDGKIVHAKEYMDTHHAAEVWLGG
jgi:ketosteroid isomerase-like protein